MEGKTFNWSYQEEYLAPGEVISGAPIVMWEEDEGGGGDWRLKVVAVTPSSQRVTIIWCVAHLESVHIIMPRTWQEMEPPNVYGFV